MVFLWNLSDAYTASKQLPPPPPTQLLIIEESLALIKATAKPLAAQAGSKTDWSPSNLESQVGLL